MKPSGKWQAQVHFCGKSRYIGVYPTLQKALFVYDEVRRLLEGERQPYAQGYGGEPGKGSEDVVKEAKRRAERMYVGEME